MRNDSANKQNQLNLFTPEEPPSKKLGFFMGLFIIFLSFCLLLFGGLPQYFQVSIGILSFLTVLLISFYYGYPGLWLALILGIIGMTYQFNLWIKTGDLFNFSVVTVHFLNICASGIIAHGVEKESKRKKLLEWLSITDGMTELYNHRYFYNRLQEEISRAERHGGILGLCMIDIDQLKGYNDSKGHAAGDEAIRRTAKVIKDNLRKCDVVCRYGGDEFAVILPSTVAEDVYVLMERVKAAFHAQNISHYSSGTHSRLTLSMGFSIFPTLARDKDELISQADAALYHAKGMGRNRIEQFQPAFESIDPNLSSVVEMKGSMKALIRSVVGKDKYSYGHPERVANYSVLLGRALGMPEEKLELLRIGALLHDIGNIEIPDEILNKKDQLTPEEFEVIKEHPVFSANIIKALSQMDNLLDDIRHHHERYDGYGYPDGIGKGQIPIGARIIAIADAFDAMQSDRPYRKAMSIEEAVEELQEHSGTQFDPELVRLFLSQLNAT